MTDRRYYPEGELLRTKENAEYTSSADMLERAMREGRILEGIAVRCDCTDMTLTVRVGDFNGYIYRRDAAYSPDGGDIKDIAVITRVGRAVCFTVRGFFTDSDGRTALRLSRADAQRRCWEDYISHLRPGDVIPSCVTHLESFGAFVDIGCGTVALMTVDTMSVSRISHPRERLLPGERIWSVVKEISREGDSPRIYMSLRELLGTWEENAAMFSAAETVTGTVRSVENYGVFVELTPNLCGLAELRHGVEIGKSCSVYIKNIIPERMKIKLIIIDSSVQAEREALKFFIDGERCPHIERWRYSPDCCPRVVETDFAALPRV